jgi:hypothetical protein
VKTLRIMNPIMDARTSRPPWHIDTLGCAEGKAWLEQRNETPNGPWAESETRIKKKELTW